jgi:hypothetical protein
MAWARCRTDSAHRWAAAALTVGSLVLSSCSGGHGTQSGSTTSDSNNGTLGVKVIVYYASSLATVNASTPGRAGYGVRVTARDASGHTVNETTDPVGQTTFDLPAGTYTVATACAAPRTFPVTVPAGSLAPLTISCVGSSKG